MQRKLRSYVLVLVLVTIAAGVMFAWSRQSESSVAAESEPTAASSDAHTIDSAPDAPSPTNAVTVTHPEPVPVGVSSTAPMKAIAGEADVLKRLLVEPTTPFEADFAAAAADRCATRITHDDTFPELIARLQQASGQGDLSAAVAEAYVQAFSTVGSTAEVNVGCGVYLCAVEAHTDVASEDDPIWQAVVERLLGPNDAGITSTTSPADADGRRRHRALFAVQREWIRLAVAARTPAGKQASERACEALLPHQFP